MGCWELVFVWLFGYFLAATEISALPSAREVRGCGTQKDCPEIFLLVL
jgi:hypothetical protein